MTTLYRAILITGFIATASFADIDSQRMQRDIRIMEGVLANENLYYDVPDGASFRARGLYLDGLWGALCGGRPSIRDGEMGQKVIASRITGCNPRPARRISRQLRRHH